MTKYILSFVFLLTVGLTYGQTTTSPEYDKLIKQADSLYKAKDYKNSALTYSEAFKTNGWKGFANNRYDAACSWSLAGNADSAFFNLQRITDKLKFSDYKRVTTDSDFKPLYADARWTPLIFQIRQNKEIGEAGFNIPLLRLLDSMVTEDQKWRHYMTDHANGELNDDTISINTINKNCWLTDSLNYFHLKEIFTKYGYPNDDLVGQEGSSNFWLLVQHQDRHPTFQDSVLTKMKIEVDANKANGRNYAYLVDRVKVNTGQLQVYGTQCELNKEQTSYVPKPVIEPDKLNERRKSVGLDSIEIYIEVMNGMHSGTLKKK